MTKLNPRQALQNRANRLDRLCGLDAPAVVLNAEVRLINQANESLLQKEEPDLLTTLTANGFMTEEALRATYNRCMDMLGDVPGDALEQRLTNYVGWYMALQVTNNELREQIQGASEPVKLGLHVHSRPKG